MGDRGEQVGRYSWFRRMGWRYVAAIASLVVFVALAVDGFGEVEALQSPLMALFASILVVVLAIPTKRPRGENEWFRALGSLGTALAFTGIAWLSVDEEVKTLVEGQGGDESTFDWIILAYGAFGLTVAGVVVFLGWLFWVSGWKQRR